VNIIIIINIYDINNNNMDLLPKEIIMVILEELPITGKRNLIRCNKELNKFSIEKYENQFMKMINDENYLGTKIKQLDSLGKYTLEILYDGYANLLPKIYIIKENKILNKYEEIYFNIAKKNFRELLEILIRHNRKYGPNILCGAARGGNLELLQWCWENVDILRKIIINTCWSYSIYTCAIKSGNLNILKFLRENNWYWDSNICAKAAKYGNLEMLKWLRENGCDWDSYVYAKAAKNGYLEVLKWAHENGCKLDCEICEIAVENNHFEILKWAHENGCYLSFSCLVKAAENGNLEILKYIIETGYYPCGSFICNRAAANGHLNILKWYHENGYKWDDDTCACAAEYGHLEVLKWLRENGCNWNSDVCTYAVENSYLEVLIWARENGCPENIIDPTK
jgi:hypothetical protein